MATQIASESFVTVAEVRADDECACVTDATPSDAIIQSYIDAASDLIAITTGMRIAGQQNVIARPCRTWCDYVCCPCCGLDVIPLTDEAVTVTAVKIDGVTLDTSEYWLHHNRTHWVLGRRPAADETYPRSWPTGQHRWALDTEDDTFAIYFTQGVDVDQHLIKTATLEIVCDFAAESRLRDRNLDGVTQMTIGGTTAVIDEDRLERIRMGAMGPMSTRLMGVLAPEGRGTSQVWAPELTYGGWELNLTLDSGS
jgi:hypothetical protein